MDEDISDSENPCNVCGTKKRVVREGYFYCFECGTRCADTNQLLDYGDDFLSGTKIVRKKATAVKEQLGSVWSTWHGYNIILCGLAGELGACCSKEDELKKSALKLWGMFLNKNHIAFYSTKRDPKFPKLTYSIHQKDLEYLYNMKRPKRSRQKVFKAIDGSDDKRKLKIKGLLINRHFQTVSQTSNTASQTLSQLKTIELEKPNEILLTYKARRFLNKSLSMAKIKEHAINGFCSRTCRCLLKKTKIDKKFQFSIFNLYVILILSLRINDDEVHIGDVIRWCREDHLSFCNYKHFFPEDMIFKKSDPLFKVPPSCLSHRTLRLTAGRLARFFNLPAIKAPDIKLLVQRYLKELELPYELDEYVLRLVEVLGPLPNFDTATCHFLPNYEAKVLAYIIITLKMIFGFDNVTENIISSQAQLINKVLSLEKIEKRILIEDVHNYEKNKPKLKTLFVWKSWTKYIEYRKICLSEYHYPTRLRHYPNDCEKPDLFLHHKKITRRDYEPEHIVKNKNHILMKTILEDIQFDYDYQEETFPTFSCSLYPMSSSVEHLLLVKFNSSSFNREILAEDFSSCDISFLFRPNIIKEELKKRKIALHIYPSRSGKTKKIPGSKVNVDEDRAELRMDAKYDIKIKNCTVTKWEKVLLSERISQIVSNRLNELNEEISEMAITNHEVKKTKKEINPESDKFTYLNICHSDYWIRHYKYFHRLSQAAFEAELNQNFPRSFAWLIRECAQMAEMSSMDLYNELMILERKLINFKNK